MEVAAARPLSDQDVAEILDEWDKSCRAQIESVWEHASGQKTVELSRDDVWAPYRGTTDGLDAPTLEKVWKVYSEVSSAQPSWHYLKLRREALRGQVLGRLENWNSSSIPSFLNRGWWLEFWQEPGHHLDTCKLDSLQSLIDRFSAERTATLFETVKHILGQHYGYYVDVARLLEFKAWSPSEMEQLLAIASAKERNWDPYSTFRKIQIDSRFTPPEYLHIVQRILENWKASVYPIFDPSKDPITSDSDRQNLVELLSDYSVWSAFCYMRHCPNRFSKEVRREIATKCFRRDAAETPHWAWGFGLLTPEEHRKRWPHNSHELLASITARSCACDERPKLPDSDTVCTWRPNALKLHQDRLEEHAYRRVLFFYYLLIATYNTDCFYTTHATYWQYGIGMDDQQAAHSSILPNLCQCIEPKCKGDPSQPHVWEGVTLARQYFFHALNSTVWISKKANKGLDSALEDRVRLSALEILNRVADSQRDCYTPEEGIRDFVAKLDEVFRKLAQDPKYRDSEGYKHEYRGTISVWGDTPNVIPDPFFRLIALLEVNRESKYKADLKLNRWSDLTSTKKEIYLHIQSEMSHYDPPDKIKDGLEKQF